MVDLYQYDEHTFTGAMLLSHLFLCICPTVCRVYFVDKVSIGDNYRYQEF